MGIVRFLWISLQLPHGVPSLIRAYVAIVVSLYLTL
jgi:hypothetical protein